MHEAVKAEHFQDLVRNQRTFAFAQQIITRSYMECAPGQEQLMRDLLQRAFATLAEAGQDRRAFERAVCFLMTDIFCKGEPEFWFNRLYRDYKQGFKPRNRFGKLRPWIQGRRVLDLGCGNGLTALALQENGYQVCLTDVLDYRDPAARSLPFAPMTGARIPYADGEFDTALVIAVLHHVTKEDLQPLLAELRRTSRRLIVEEDCYDLPLDLESLGAVLERDDQLRSFLALPLEDQLRYLMFVDYFSNAITQGLPQMHIPFHFRTFAEWEDLFASQGFQVERRLVMGFQEGYFNRSCHVWFVLERV